MSPTYVVKFTDRAAEADITLRDIIASGSTVCERIGRALKTLAAGRRIRQADISLWSACLRNTGLAGQLALDIDGASVAPGKSWTKDDRRKALAHIERQRNALDDLERAAQATPVVD